MSYNPVEIPADIPAILPILPLLATVVYPATVVPLAITQPESLLLINTVLEQEGIVGMAALRDGQPIGSANQPCFSIGTVVRIHRLLRLPDGTLRIAVEGLARFEIKQLIQHEPWLNAEIVLYDDTADTLVSAIVMQQVAENTCEFLDRVTGTPGDLQAQILREADPQRLSFLIAQTLMARRPVAERQELLELTNTTERLERLLAITRRELELVQRLSQTQIEREHALLALPEQPIEALQLQNTFDIMLARRIFAENIVGYHEICEVLIGYMAAYALRRQRATVAPLLQPLCLVGAAQVGKSALIQAMARAAGYQYQRVDGRLFQEQQAPSFLDARHNGSIRIIEIDHSDQLMPEVAAILARMIDSQAEMAHIQDIPTTTIFVFAARVATAIPEVIRERIALVTLPSLTDAERLLITHEVLLPLQIQIHGLDLAEVQIDATLIETIVQTAKTEGMGEITYTLAQWCRNAALQVVARQQGLEVGNRPIVME